MARTDEGTGIHTRRVTIKDVAQLAGVTPAMVSFTLSGKRKASPKTHEAIFHAARELGYVPDPHAQRLASGQRDNTVDLFVMGLDRGVATDKAQEIQRLLGNRGFRVPLHGYGYHLKDKVGAQVELFSQLRARRPLAIILATMTLESEAIEELRHFIEEGGIAVCYGWPRDVPCDAVWFNTASSVGDAARYLIAQGHRKIGFSSYFGAHPDDAMRRAVEEVLRENGVEPQAQWMVSNEHFEEGGADLADWFCQLPTTKRPSAMIVVNDMAASSFVAQLWRRGISVPGDLSIMGHDDVPAARFGLVPLTTMRHPTPEIAATAVDFLLSRLEGRYTGAPRVCELPTQLVVRESTAPYLGLPQV